MTLRSCRNLLLTLCILLLACPVDAAWAFVSGAVCLQTNPTTKKQVTKAVTAGNLIIIAFANGDATSPSAISDGGVNTYTACAGSPTNDGTNAAGVAMWWAIAATSATITTTVTANATTFIGTSMAEYSGNASSTPNDGGAGTANITGSTTTDAMKSGSFSPATDGVLVVSTIVDDGASPTVTQFTAGTGFTKRTTASRDPNGAGESTFAVEDIVQSSHAAINPSWTEAAADKAVAMACAFKVATGGVITPTRSLLGVGTN